jgi:hypothetical protein
MYTFSITTSSSNLAYKRSLLLIFLIFTVFRALSAITPIHAPSSFESFRLNIQARNVSKIRDRGFKISLFRRDVKAVISGICVSAPMSQDSISSDLGGKGEDSSTPKQTEVYFSFASLSTFLVYGNSMTRYGKLLGEISATYH